MGGCSFCLVNLVLIPKKIIKKSTIYSVNSGVRNFSSTRKSLGPWKKILKFFKKDWNIGSNLFDRKKDNIKVNNENLLENNITNNPNIDNLLENNSNITNNPNIDNLLENNSNITNNTNIDNLLDNNSINTNNSQSDG